MSIKLLIINSTNDYAVNIINKQEYIKILKENKSSIDEQLKEMIRLSNGIDIDKLEETK